MRKITVNGNKIKGERNPYASWCVGAGRAGEMLRKRALDQLAEVHEECGFQYLRFHGLFFEEMGVCVEENGGIRFNWEYVDMVFDEILALGVKPFVELSFTPKVMASGERTVFWWKANITPPKDCRLWSEMIESLIAHLIRRYGSDEVESWPFEVWNEPNHPGFYTADMQEYFKLYRTTAEAVKRIDGAVLIGGPATAGSAWIPELIAFCSENGVPLDFVSSHAYGARGDFDESGTKQIWFRREQDEMVNEILKVERQVKESAMPDLPIHYTEWGASYSNRDAVHDSYVQASYLLYHLKRLEGHVASMSYWIFTDMIEEISPVPAPFHGGFGLLNLQGYRKPSFYAYQFLNRLGNCELVNNDSDSFVCKSGEGYQILFWHYEVPKQDCPNAVYFNRDLPAEEREPVEIVFEDLALGKYDLTITRTGYRANDVFTEYLSAEWTDLPTREEEEALKRASDGSPEREEEITVGESGEYRFRLPIRNYDCVLVMLSS